MTIGAEVQCAVQRLYLTAAAHAAPHLLNFLSENKGDGSSNYFWSI